MHPQLRVWVTDQVMKYAHVSDRDDPYLHKLAGEFAYKLQTTHNPPIPDNAVFMVAYPNDISMGQIYRNYARPEPVTYYQGDDISPFATMSVDHSIANIMEFRGSVNLGFYPPVEISLRIGYDQEFNRLYAIDDRPLMEWPAMPKARPKTPKVEVTWRESTFKQDGWIFAKWLDRVEAWGNKQRRAVGSIE